MISVIFPSVPQFPCPAKATVRTDELGWCLGPHLVHRKLFVPVPILKVEVFKCDYLLIIQSILRYPFLFVSLPTGLWITLIQVIGLIILN